MLSIRSTIVDDVAFALVNALAVTDALVGTFEIQLPFQMVSIYLSEFSFYLGVSFLCDKNESR